MDNAINYVSVVVAAIAMMVIGGLWYGPFFGKQWMHLMHFTKDSMKQTHMSPAKAMSLMFVAALVTCYVLAHFVKLLGVSGFGGAFQFVFFIWLGLIATTMAGQTLFEARPFKLYLIGVLQVLVSFFAAVLVLVFWP